jgi:hypothetical protein
MVIEEVIEVVREVVREAKGDTKKVYTINIFFIKITREVTQDIEQIIE